ncbi:MAG TPA: hypothetical protein VGK54_16195 [Chloroflexota bacterium]|jgi:small neutral amino acid transporter SnatA (MarC family)
MDRARTAFLIPLTVGSAAIATALFIGWTLHQFPKELAPVIALILVLVATFGGMWASRKA